MKLCMGEAHESVGRAEVQVCIERAGIRTAKSVRLMGARRVRASIAAAVDWDGDVATTGCCAVVLSGDLDGERGCEAWKLLLSQDARVQRGLDGVTTTTRAFKKT